MHAVLAKSYYIINAITLYRLLMAPVLIYLVLSGKMDIFCWLLAISFFTDAIDGFLARKFKTVSALGARMDSLADDLTVTAGIVGVFVFKPEFVKNEAVLITIMLALLFIQILYALFRYGKMTSFHTYIAKAAAVSQAIFLVLLFFLDNIPFNLFYAAAFLTILNLLEEIIIIYLLPQWKADVKGLFWVIKSKDHF